MLTISRIGDSMAALTETPAPVRFDPATLETLGAYRYRDDMVGQISTAHPQLDVPPPFGRAAAPQAAGLTVGDSATLVACPSPEEMLESAKFLYSMVLRLADRPGPRLAENGPGRSCPY